MLKAIFALLLTLLGMDVVGTLLDFGGIGREGDDR